MACAALAHANAIPICWLMARPASKAAWLKEWFPPVPQPQSSQVPFMGTLLVSADLTADEIPATGGHRLFVPLPRKAVWGIWIWILSSQYSANGKRVRFGPILFFSHSRRSQRKGLPNARKSVILKHICKEVRLHAAESTEKGQPSRHQGGCGFAERRHHQLRQRSDRHHRRRGHQ